MATKSVKQMCCVRIGFQYFLLPADTGLRVVALMMGTAVLVEPAFTRDIAYRITGEHVQIQMEVLKASQIIQEKFADSKSIPKNE